MKHTAPSSVRLRLLFFLGIFITAFGSQTVKAQTSPPNQVSNMTTSGGAAASLAADDADAQFQKDLALFEESRRGRFFGAFEYDYQRVEQPTVLVTAAGQQVSDLCGLPLDSKSEARRDAGRQRRQFQCLD